MACQQGLLLVLLLLPINFTSLHFNTCCWYALYEVLELSIRKHQPTYRMYTHEQVRWQLHNRCQLNFHNWDDNMVVHKDT
jgi:hypothetical protein